MIFNQVVMASDKLDPTRWLAVCKDYKYIIASYVFSGKGKPCERYYKAYVYPSGTKVIVNEKSEYKDFGSAMYACEEHYKSK